MNEEQIKQWVMGELQKGVQPQTVASQLASGGVPQDAIIRVFGALQAAAQPQPQVQQQPWAQQQGGFGGAAMGAGGGAPTAVPQYMIDKVGHALGEAKDGNNSGRKLPSGVHFVRTKGFAFRPTHYQKQGIFFHEFDVAESSNPETEIGGSYDHGMDPNHQYDYDRNDMRGLLNAAVEAKLGQNARVAWDPRFFAAAISDAQPFRGMLWRVETHIRPNKTNSEHVKVIHEYTAVPPGTTSLGLTAVAQAQPQTTAITMPAGGGLPASLFGAAPQQAQPVQQFMPQPQAQPWMGAAPVQGTPMTPGVLPPNLAAMFAK